jgi:hypothetical protein
VNATPPTDLSATRQPGWSDLGGCPHCPDGHTPFGQGSHPWNVFVAPDRDSDGQPTHLVVMRSAGEHCAQSDADALYELINGRKP